MQQCIPRQVTQMQQTASKSSKTQHTSPPTPNPLSIPELLHLIFVHTDHKTLGRCSAVCDLWNEISGELLYMHLEVTLQEFIGPIMRGLKASRQITGGLMESVRPARPLFLQYTKRLTIDMNLPASSPTEIIMLPVPKRIEMLDLKFDTICSSVTICPTSSKSSTGFSTLKTAITPSTLRIHGAPPLSAVRDDFSLLEKAGQITIIGDLKIMHQWSKILTEIDNSGGILPPLTFIMHTSSSSDSTSIAPDRPNLTRRYEMKALVEFLTAATPWNASIRKVTIYLLDDIVLTSGTECDVVDLEVLLCHSDVQYTQEERRWLRLRSRAEYLAEEHSDLPADDLRCLKLRDEGGDGGKEPGEDLGHNEVYLSGSWTVVR